MLAAMNGTLIHYDRRGNDAGHMPLVLLHAFPLSSAMWEFQGSILGSTRLIITMDFRGFGRSAVGEMPYSLETLVDDLFALLDRLRLGPVALGGISMGGYVALRAVEREPERFGGLILADTRSDADTDDRKVKRAAAIRALREGGLDRFADNFLKDQLSAKTLSSSPEIVERVRSLILRHSSAGLAHALLAMAGRTDTTAMLSKLDIPTLVVVGAEDRTAPPEVAKAMADKIHGSELKILPGVGHLSNMEAPELFSAALSDFLERSVSRGTRLSSG